ncbi:hypothetical protein SAMN04488056_105112 [Cohaesibacter marisflavi]|uniref:Uncharacterized protein n=1 Tax=Cohaesibacter marisflavi TaxID=655353 RepID=A0A1I5GR88_9HYPH|nr:hypothetical protein [Cohaesibacter marisflavi]SFO38071.1 hypothetical protein SAMN04488056_105112 [Cohaesibacter marisflavi]
MEHFDPEKVFNGHRDRYMEILKPLFFPHPEIQGDVVCYFASLLRMLGIEDKGWDPYAESKSILDDLNRLMKTGIPEEEKTPWRLGLLLYCHIVEMDAPYDVLANLLRYRLGKGYSPSPFYDFLGEKEKKNFAKNGIRTGRKIAIIKELSVEADLKVGDIFEEFYNNKLRNAVQHSDFILEDKEFRSRNGISGVKSFVIDYEKIDVLITKSKAFIAAFFKIEIISRQIWGLEKGKAIPYDDCYKGLLEILVDDRDLLCGFSVHWPNNSQSVYRRTETGIEMINCSLNVKEAGVNLWVDLYARNPGQFSPLVEHDAEPIYAPLENSDIRPSWPK